MHQVQEVLTGILTKREQLAIMQAALLAFEGREAEAEAARYAAGYHNLDHRPDADRA